MHRTRATAKLPAVQLVSDQQAPRIHDQGDTSPDSNSPLSDFMPESSVPQDRAFRYSLRVSAPNNSPPLLPRTLPRQRMAENDVYMPLVKLPTFWPEQIHRWYTLVEARFTCYKVQDDDIRFNSVLNALDRPALKLSLIHI